MLKADDLPVVDRHRTYGWEDPSISAGAAARMDGLTFLRAMADGTIPPAPVAATIGFTVRSVEPGRVVFELQPAEHLYNPIGLVHGGVLATLLDSATGCAVHSTLPQGTSYASVDLTVKFLRAVRADTPLLTCEGTVIQAGGRTALAEARLYGEGERLYAHATSTVMIFRPESGRGDRPAA